MHPGQAPRSTPSASPGVDHGARPIGTPPGPKLEAAPDLVYRLATIGVTAADPDEIRVQKVSLTLAAVVVTVLAVFWVATYLVLGLPRSAAIPFGYQVASVVTLVAFARTKDVRLLRFSQIVLMLLLPFLLQWSLGGFVASSVVSLWAFVAVLGSVFFFSARGAVPWFMAFVLLTVLSGIAEPWLAESAAAIPDRVQDAFFVLNIVGPAVTTFVLLQVAVRERDMALATSDGLLLNVLPASIAHRLKRTPGVIADRHEDVSILLADVVGFTPFAERVGPEEVVGLLDTLFSEFDHLTAAHGLEKIKTIGDAYMVAGGLPEQRPDHLEAMADLALAMLDAVARPRDRDAPALDLRIGLDVGPVVAGVIGHHKFSFDVWGDTVNSASRMESHGVPGRIQVAESVFERLRDRYRFEDRGEIEVKGKARQRAYLLVGPHVGTIDPPGPAA